MTSSPTISRFEAPAGDSPLIALGGARVLAGELRPVSRQLRDLRAALLRPAADARLRARLFDFSRRGEPVPVGGDWRVGGRDGLRRNAVGRLGAQDGDDGVAGRSRGGDARRLLFTELDDLRRAPRADRPCAFRRSGGRDGLSRRGDGSFGDRTGDGSLYRRQYAGGHGRAPGERRRSPTSAAGAGAVGDRRPHFARLRRPCSLFALPRERRAGEGAKRPRFSRDRACISATRA